MRSGATPVIVGASQRSWRHLDPADAASAPSPLDALEQVTRSASEDAGGGRTLLGAIDTIGCVDFMGWRPRNGPRLLAERLGLGSGGSRCELQAALGGESGLSLVNEIADRIRRGDSEVALVGSTHQLRTRADAYAAGIELDWPEGGEGRPEALGAPRPGSCALEEAYGLAGPTVVYPVFENALRARRGLTLDAHRRGMGALFERFTRVAARNPQAWFPTERSARELVDPTAQNRMIVYPYTKYLNAVMRTNQAASILLCSEARARALGLTPERFVYWHAGAAATEDPWFVSDRADLARSEALRASARATLGRGHATLDEVAAFDFYSCFPSAVSIACEMLGLAEDDPRGFTVCGGLPYAGGPGNGYTLHALASMVERLRSEPGARGLCTGNGWYLTKHSAALLAARPPEHDLVEPAAVPAPGARVAVTASADGAARIESYAVVYGREGAPERGIVVGRLGGPDESGEDGAVRFLANTPDDPALLGALVASEAIGRTGRVTCIDGSNRFDPD